MDRVLVFRAIEPPLHDFPDRAIRKLLENPGNLRDPIAAVVPDLVERFDFGRLEERFGSLPEGVVQRIEAATDLERLRSAMRQVVHMADLSELDL